MKKIIYFTVSILIVAGLFSCGDDDKTTPREVNIGNLEINLGILSVEDYPYYYIESIPVSLAGITELEDYIDWIKSVSFSGVKLKGFADGVTIEELSLVALGSEPNSNLLQGVEPIRDFPFNPPWTPSAQIPEQLQNKLASFCNALLEKLIQDSATSYIQASVKIVGNMPMSGNPPQVTSSFILELQNVTVKGE